MQIVLKSSRLFPALSILIAVLCAPLALAAAPAAHVRDKPENTVKRLYRDYAWQAIGSTAFDPDVTYLLHQGMPELEKYFEPGLAKLIRKGDECEQKTQEMCGPDFDYIFNSQDNAAADLEISRMNQKGIVKVKFYHPFARQTMRLNYKLVQTAKGWRIADIYYADTKGGLRDSLLYVFELIKYPPYTPLAKPDEPPTHFADTPKGVVQKLYYDYAWQAIASFDSDAATPIENQTMPELEKYFEGGLARGIRADHDCAEKSGKKCSLDYSILYNSPKPNAVDLSISPPDKRNRVEVTFKYRSGDKLIRLHYDMVKTENGWRVYDINYPNKKQSLRAGLQDK